MTPEWLSVVPWILGAMAVGLGVLVFTDAEPAIEPRPGQPAQATAQVIDLAEFRRRSQAAGMKQRP